MDRNKQKKLNNAIDIVENAGGIVIIDEEHIEQQICAIEAKEHQKTINQAKKSFTKMVDKGSSMSSIEDMMYGYGLEADYLEDFIHEMY